MPHDHYCPHSSCNWVHLDLRCFALLHTVLSPCGWPCTVLSLKYHTVQWWQLGRQPWSFSSIAEQTTLRPLKNAIDSPKFVVVVNDICGYIVDWSKAMEINWRVRYLYEGFVEAGEAKSFPFHSCTAWWGYPSFVLPACPPSAGFLIIWSRILNTPSRSVLCYCSKISVSLLETS